jgi:hypothetical protein
MFHSQTLPLVSPIIVPLPGSNSYKTTDETARLGEGQCKFETCMISSSVNCHQDCCIADGYYCCVVGRHFFFFFLSCRIVVCAVGLVIRFLQLSICILYTLLSKVTWHGRAKCLPRGPCVQECMDS